MSADETICIGRGKLTASIDCFKSIKSLSKHSCWDFTVFIAQTKRCADDSPSPLSGLRKQLSSAYISRSVLLNEEPKRGFVKQVGE